MSKPQINNGAFLNQSSNRVFGKDNRLYLMGFSMLWIVLFHISFWFHLGGQGNTPWWINMFSEGQLGVDIFLFLSAYGLEASFDKNTIHRFYLNRIKRLFPVYFFFLLFLFVTFERNCPIERIIIQCVCQITGLSLIKYPYFFSSGFCFDWFTPAIIIVYVSFPLISYVARFVEDKNKYWEFLLLLFIVVIGHWIHVNKHFSFSLLAYRGPIILMGVLTFRHLQRGDIERLLELYVIAACLGFLCTEKSIILSLLVPSVLLVFSLTNCALPFTKLFSIIGKYSYEVYLAHIFFVAFFIPMGMVKNPLALLLVVFGGSALVAILLSFLHNCFYKCICH